MCGAWGDRRCWPLAWPVVEPWWALSLQVCCSIVGFWGYPRLAGSLAASYIGGSINFVGVGRALNLSDLLFSAATTADNLLTAVWLAITLTLPSLLARFYPSRDAEATVRVMPLPTTSAIAPVDLAILLSLAIAILVLSTALHQFWPLIPTIVWLTTLSLALAQFKWMRYLRGTGALGMFGLNLFYGDWCRYPCALAHSGGTGNDSLYHHDCVYPRSCHLRPWGTPEVGCGTACPCLPGSCWHQPQPLPKPRVGINPS